jgi:ubiquinone/menaquinone biosynthesis C-methylase UbiE
LLELNNAKVDIQERQPEEGWKVSDLMMMHLGFAPSRILATALELSVFSHISAGKKTVEEVAAAAGTTERGMHILLDALVGIQLLNRNSQGYMLTPIAAQCLVRESPDYMGDMLGIDRIWAAWGNLTETVRTGKPHKPVEHQKEAEVFFPKLIRGLHIMNREPARRTAEALGIGTDQGGLRVLDVACGSAVWSIAIAEADKQARVTAQDFPGVLGTTKEFVKRHGLEDRYDFLPGNLKELDFGTEHFDLIVLGNIVHSEGESSSRALFRKAHRALRASGRMVIIDMIPNDERTGPPFSLLFAVNMLVNTEFGNTYTLAEYTSWLQEAGFGRVETIDIDWHSPILLACK